MGAISKIIKFEGDNSTFIWKHPCEDFNTTTQLIVHESQEAIFFMNGQALDSFGPGRHTIEAQNIPQIGRLLNLATDSGTPFHCEIYFINKAVQMAVKWGTDSKVRFIEPVYGVPLEIGACGEMNLMVSNSRKLLVKLVGTMKGIAWGDRSGGFAKSLAVSFRSLISNAVKTQLPSCIKSQNINILEIDENLGLLSDVLGNSIRNGFEEYGLSISEFYVTNVALPEDDKNYKRIRELHTIVLQKKVVEAESFVKSAMAEAEAAVTIAERKAALEREVTATEIARLNAERELIRAQTEAQTTRLAGFAEAEVMRAKGYTERDIIQADVQKAYAEGIGNLSITGNSGGVAGDMLGVGLGMAAASAISPQVIEMFKGFSVMPGDPNQLEKVTCPNCGNEVPGNSKFCFECGTKIEMLNEDEMLCPVCGKKTSKGKFCMECGAPLIAKCSNCGANMPSSAKFCVECGMKRGNADE